MRSQQINQSIDHYLLVLYWIRLWSIDDTDGARRTCTYCGNYRACAVLARVPINELLVSKKGTK